MRTRKLIAQLSKALRKTRLAALTSPVVQQVDGTTQQVYHLVPETEGYVDAVRFFRDRLEGDVASALDMAPVHQHIVTVYLTQCNLAVVLNTSRGKFVAEYNYEVCREVA